MHEDLADVRWYVRSQSVVFANRLPHNLDLMGQIFSGRIYTSDDDDGDGTGALGLSSTLQLVLLQCWPSSVGPTHTLAACHDV